MTPVVKGRVWKLPDEIDTDALAPTKYLTSIDPAGYSPHCLEDIKPDFAPGVKEGDVILAGYDFGRGSSREQASLALKHLGIRAVVARSVSPITKRNLFNLGIPVFIDPDLYDRCDEGDEVEVRDGIFSDTTKGWESPLEPLPAFMLTIIENGGLFGLLLKRGGISSRSTPIEEGTEIKGVGRTKIFPAYEKYVDTVAELLNRGEVLCGPFDTTYGLFASIRRPEAVSRIYKLKKRRDSMPLTMIVPRGRFHEYAEIPDDIQELINGELKGPVSVILKKKKDKVPDYVTSGMKTVSLADGENPFMRRVMEKVELCGTSANIHGQPPPSTLSRALSQMGQELTLAVDGGPTLYRIGHTVLDLVSDPPKLIRKGPFPAKKLFDLFPDLIGDREEIIPDELLKGRSIIDIKPEVDVRVDGTEEVGEADL